MMPKTICIRQTCNFNGAENEINRSFIYLFFLTNCKVVISRMLVMHMWCCATGWESMSCNSTWCARDESSLSSQDPCKRFKITFKENLKEARCFSSRANGSRTNRTPETWEVRQIATLLALLLSLVRLQLMISGIEMRWTQRKEEWNTLFVVG